MSETTPVQNTTGCFITIEGIEGAGKTTIAKRLEQWLSSQGFSIIYTREPGGTEVGESIRQILLSSTFPLEPEVELLLIEAARAQLMRNVVIPSLNQGKIVILDRHTDSTMAYQGYGRHVELAKVDYLNQFATWHQKPDLTIILDIDVKHGIQRVQERNHGEVVKDRFESESIEFMTQVRKGFLELAKNDPERYIVISSEESIEKVWAEVERLVEKRLITS